MRVNMDLPYRSNLDFSPYRLFSREEWARLRADTPMTLVPRELEQLSGLIEELSMEEVETIYLPMSRLLNLYVQASQELHRAHEPLPRPQGPQSTVHHRGCWLCRRRQEHHRPCAARVARPLAGSSARRSHHHRWFPVAQCPA